VENAYALLEPEQNYEFRNFLNLYFKFLVINFAFRIFFFVTSLFDIKIKRKRGGGEKDNNNKAFPVSYNILCDMFRL
jgi:hypothetical protein